MGFITGSSNIISSSRHHAAIFLALVVAHAFLALQSQDGGGKPSSSTKAWLVEQEAYWSQWVASRGLDRPEDFQERLQVREIGDKFKELVNPAVADASWHYVRILDAAAGPMTILGSTWAGKMLDLRACDALAPRFDRMLRRHGVVPPVRTVFAELEHLSAVFGSDAFDLVVIREAIDRTMDPVAAVKDALEVTRPNGTVWLGGKVHRGLAYQYEGARAWNVDLWDGYPIIWNARAMHNLTALFRNQAVVASKSSGDWVEVLLLKAPQQQEHHEQHQPQRQPVR
jgi:hypothetical protein